MFCHVDDLIWAGSEAFKSDVINKMKTNLNLELIFRDFYSKVSNFK